MMFAVSAVVILFDSELYPSMDRRKHKERSSTILKKFGDCFHFVQVVTLGMKLLLLYLL